MEKVQRRETQDILWLSSKMKFHKSIHSVKLFLPFKCVLVRITAELGVER